MIIVREPYNDHAWVALQRKCVGKYFCRHCKDDNSYKLTKKHFTSCIVFLHVLLKHQQRVSSSILTLSAKE